MKIYALLFILTFKVFSYAEDKTIEYRDTDKSNNESNKESHANENKKKWGITPVGIPYYTPDTSWGVGGEIIFYKNTVNPSDNSSRTDEIAVYGTYTLLNQTAAGVTSNIFIGDKLKTTGIIEFNRYPGFFWGIGPDTKNSAKEEYTPVTFVTKESLLYNFFNNFYIGPLFTFHYTKIIEKEDGSLIDSGNIKGSSKVRSVGAGININWSNIDSYFYPHKGFYIDIKESNFVKAIGSTYNYVKWEFDLRYFLQLYNDHVIGFQCVSQLSKGDVPLHNLAELGGNEIMRGLLLGRYVDKNLVAVQAEYRYPLFWRIGGTLFASAGTVAPALGKFSIDYARKAAGAGLRVNIDKSQHINLRLDAGVNEDSDVNAYFMIKEAF